MFNTPIDIIFYRAVYLNSNSYCVYINLGLASAVTCSHFFKYHYLWFAMILVLAKERFYRVEEGNESSAVMSRCLFGAVRVCRNWGRFGNKHWLATCDAVPSLDTRPDISLLLKRCGKFMHACQNITYTRHTSINYHNKIQHYFLFVLKIHTSIKQFVNNCKYLLKCYLLLFYKNVYIKI